MKKPLPSFFGITFMTSFRQFYSIIFTLLCLALILPITSQAQYLHTSGKKILDGNNQEIILRGMGLGGWMLQEGYMLETSAFANPQFQIRGKIADVIGEANTAEFYNAWLANHVTERDIDSLARWGFNSVRLPMHYNLYTLPIEAEPVAGQNTWLDKGFALTDSLLKWCEKNEMFLILDLHAAPGGQGKDAGISDYDNTKPSLWESEANKQKTIALWKKLAERYATKKWIGGYDLLNETNWNFTPGANQNGCAETTNAPLKNLLVAIKTAIREVDPNHMIIIEGNCWANNHNGLWPIADNNIVASFHKYWNYNDQGSIQGLLNLRESNNIPLWMGESGENSNTWFTNAIKLLETNKIGWSWWPLKKVGGVNSPFSVVKKDGYAALLNYWQNGGAKPSVATAKAALMELAEGLKIDNTLYRKDIPDAMIRQVNTTATIPYVHHAVPGLVAAVDFDLGRNNLAYADRDTANYHVTTGTFAAWNNGWAYRNDGVDIERSTDNEPAAKGYNVAWTNDDEWLQYTLDVDSSAGYQVIVRYGAQGATGQIRFETNGTASSPVVPLPSTGGYQVYGEAVVSDVVLMRGKQKLKVIFTKGGFNLSLLKIDYTKTLSDIPLKALIAESDNTGYTIYITLNKSVDAATVTSGAGFTFTVNGNAATIESVTSAGDKRLKITLAESLTDTDKLYVSYDGDMIKSQDAALLEDFSNLQVDNNMPFHFTLPTKIEAEAFVVNQGLQLETTSDAGGGQNVGYTNAGDFLEYRIRVSETGTYPLEVRIACNATAGKLKFQQLSSTGIELHSVVVDVPVTNGWQNWATVISEMELTAGSGILRVTVLQPEFNINWYKFGAPDVVSGNERDQGSLRVFPNPSTGELFIDFPKEAFSINNSLQIRSVTGSDVKHEKQLTYEALTHQNLRELPNGLYVVEFKMNGKQYRNKVIFNSMRN
jgi:endoglucanase